MEMQKSGVRERFSTRNEFERPSFMTMRLVQGPFRLLEGRWEFKPIGEAGTKIELEMRFEFANPVIGMLFGKAFEQSCNTLIDAFIARARKCMAAPERQVVEVVYALRDRQRVVTVEFVGRPDGELRRRALGPGSGIPGIGRRRAGPWNLRSGRAAGPHASGRATGSRSIGDSGLIRAKRDDDVAAAGNTMGRPASSRDR